MKWTKASEQLPPTGRDIFFKERDGSFTIDSATVWDKDITNYQWADPLDDQDADTFALEFCIWYCHAEDAQVYKSQNLPAFKMLELFKSRPYLRTDSPQSN